MQFTTLTIILAALSSFAYANRAETIKAGLRVVGNNAADGYHDTQRKMSNDANNGHFGSLWQDVAKSDEHKRIANTIGKTVGGVMRPRSLEFVGSDGNYEYFARSIDEEDSSRLFARSFEEDWEEYY